MTHLPRPYSILKIRDALRELALEKSPGCTACDTRGSAFTVDNIVGMCFWYDNPAGSTGVVSERELLRHEKYKKLYMDD